MFFVYIVMPASANGLGISLDFTSFPNKSCRVHGFSATILYVTKSSRTVECFSQLQDISRCDLALRWYIVTRFFIYI